MSKSDNAVGGDNPFSWVEYDAFPPIVRRAMQLSPLELGTWRAQNRLKLGMDPRAVANAELAFAFKLLPGVVREHWGPSHPQAVGK